MLPKEPGRYALLKRRKSQNRQTPMVTAAGCVLSLRKGARRTQPPARQAKWSRIEPSTTIPRVSNYRGPLGGYEPLAGWKAARRAGAAQRCPARGVVRRARGPPQRIPDTSPKPKQPHRAAEAARSVAANRSGGIRKAALGRLADGARPGPSQQTRGALRAPRWGEPTTTHAPTTTQKRRKRMANHVGNTPASN